MEYDSGSGKVQNVHTKQWKSIAGSDKIEARKLTGLDASDDEVQKHIREELISNCDIDNITND